MTGSHYGKKFFLVTLGCFRNEVESDLLRSDLARRGLLETKGIHGANIIVVNTCGFLKDAVDEGIDTILELDGLRDGMDDPPPILVVGCMGERYGAGLLDSMPEVGAVLGIDWDSHLDGALSALFGKGRFHGGAPARGPAAVKRAFDSSDNATLFIRIADGCDRGCLFCSIPSIRGRARSRPSGEIVEEIESLSGARPREVVLLAQDTTGYGSDLEEGVDLGGLIEIVSEMEEVRWLRLLYLQPERVTDALIEAITGNPKVCDYFDIPFQHASRHVLKRMGRPGDAGEYTRLITRMRKSAPDAALRTTMMVGYPGESEEDFTELERFIEEVSFDWLGAFVFSPEDGTPAGRLSGSVHPAIAASRYAKILTLQDSIEESRTHRLVGRKLEIVVDGVSPDNGRLLCRSYREAPVIDGVIYLVENPVGLKPGDFADVTIIGREGLDLVGKIGSGQ